jgi:hypothetical protein
MPRILTILTLFATGLVWTGDGMSAAPQASDPAAVFESAFSDRDFDLSADPTRSEWVNAPRILAGKAYDNKPVAGAPMEVRSRWTREYLYLMYACPYQELNLKPDPTPAVETPRLWTWDVAEAFIGSDFDRIGFYKEFQVSPQGEWVDLAIDRGKEPPTHDWAWRSGFEVKARLDRDKRVWYGEMRIPMDKIDTRTAKAGLEMRINLYRCQGKPPDRKYINWQPVMSDNFHTPEAFGKLRLQD